ncbi:hypothetical protein [Zavarzinella formosa]|uniref:hypothetical protein n=1 Tax=Zavarzinella formosa TaxID=360055 RepID=UPI0002D779A6|nr:hypothetical protein [Zavarzinella formosa]
MEVRENETGGRTVNVFPGDSLKRVPASHAALITSDIRWIFADVPGYFLRMAESAPVPAMAEWLRRMVAGGDWRLSLHRHKQSKETRAGFAWRSAVMHSAEIGPPSGKEWPPGPVGEFFTLIGYLDWNGFGQTGTLHPPFPVLDERSDSIQDSLRMDLSRAIAWGEFNGDMLIAISPDFGGWITISGSVVPLGTVSDSIEWVFQSLLDNRSPVLP